MSESHKMQTALKTKMTFKVACYSQAGDNGMDLALLKNCWVNLPDLTLWALRCDYCTWVNATCFFAAKLKPTLAGNHILHYLGLNEKHLQKHELLTLLMKPYLHRSISITSLTWARCIIGTIRHEGRVQQTLSVATEDNCGTLHCGGRKTKSLHGDGERWGQTESVLTAGLLSVSVLQAAAAARAWHHSPAMQADSPEIDKFQPSRETISTIRLSLKHLSLNEEDTKKH